MTPAPGAPPAAALSPSPGATRVYLCRPPLHAASGREPFVQPALPTCRLPSSHAAELAWIWGSCLQSRFLPGHTGVQRVVSGGILASENHPWTDASAILLEECNIREYVRNRLPAHRTTVRKREVFQSRDCLLRVIKNGAERIANFLCSREIRHLPVQLQSETPCRWTHSGWSCSSHLKIGNTDYAVRVVKYCARVCRTSKVLF